jgi:hypothetical protein
MSANINILMPITNSRGLCKVTYFNGLDFPVVMRPSLMGEPLFTAQGFYFVERLDSVLSIRFLWVKNLQLVNWNM